MYIIARLTNEGLVFASALYCRWSCPSKRVTSSTSTVRWTTTGSTWVSWTGCGVWFRPTSWLRRRRTSPTALVRLGRRTAREGGPADLHPPTEVTVPVPEAPLRPLEKACLRGWILGIEEKVCRYFNHILFDVTETDEGKNIDLSDEDRY